MTSRKEKRKLMRRKYRRMNTHHGPDCPTQFLIFEGDKRKVHLFARQGTIRHQPLNVRRMVLGKRHYYTRAEQEHIDGFVDRFIETVWAQVGVGMGVVTQEEADTVKQNLKDYCNTH